jgi:phosphoribosylanthranilate isomerase
VWKALGLAPEAADFRAELARLTAAATEYLAAGAEVVVLDSRTPAGFGGTGRTADWEMAAALVSRLACPVVLAGGLNAENLPAAAQAVRPAGLDVSSGIETAPGRKSAALMEQLFAQWRSLPDAGSGDEIP